MTYVVCVPVVPAGVPNVAPGIIRNLDASQTLDSNDAARRVWGWDPPYGPPVISYTSSVYNASAGHFPFSDPDNWTKGSLVATRTGPATDFPQLTPASRPQDQHTGYGTLMDTHTDTGADAPYSVFIIEVYATTAFGQGPVARAVTAAWRSF